MGPLPAVGEWVRLEVDPAIVGLEPESVLNGMAFAQFGGTAYWDLAGIATTRGSAVKHTHTEKVIAAIQVDVAVRTTSQREQIAGEYRRITPALDGIRNQIANLQKQKTELEAQIPYSLTTVSAQPRTTRVLPRGNWMDDSGEIVEPMIPAFLGDLGIKNRRPTRLELAQWVVSKEEPVDCPCLCEPCLGTLLWNRAIACLRRPRRTRRASRYILNSLIGLPCRIYGEWVERQTYREAHCHLKHLSSILETERGIGRKGCLQPINGTPITLETRCRDSP